jgi:molybdate transport system substrate-binding protein
MSRHIIRIAVVAAGLLAQVAFAAAADLKLYSTIAFQGVLEQLAPQFEKASGNKLAITFGLAAQLAQRVQAGDAVDVLILTRAGIDTLVKDGKIAPGTDVTLAGAGTAVVVKAGAPKPDISTPEALKHALLAAKSISYGDPAAGGASSVYFAKLLERMGIADAMKSKTKFPPPGKYAADVLVAGEAELGIMQTSELIPGTELVGVLPGDLNNITLFGAGLAAAAKEASAGNALLKFLRSREAAAVYKAKGLDPAEPQK